MVWWYEGCAVEGVLRVLCVLCMLCVWSVRQAEEFLCVGGILA